MPEPTTIESTPIVPEGIGSVAMTKPAKPFHTVNWLNSCDNCFYQEGRHYCLLNARTMKNMDIKRCRDWKQRQNALLELQAKRKEYVITCELDSPNESSSATPGQRL